VLNGFVLIFERVLDILEDCSFFFWEGENYNDLFVFPFFPSFITGHGNPHRCWHSALVGVPNRWKLCKLAGLTSTNAQNTQDPKSCNVITLSAAQLESQVSNLLLTLNLLCSDGVNWDIGTPSASFQNSLALQRKAPFRLTSLCWEWGIDTLHSIWAAEWGHGNEKGREPYR